MTGIILCYQCHMYTCSISAHIYLNPLCTFIEQQGTIGPAEATGVDLIVNSKLLKFPMKCWEFSWREWIKIPIDKYRHQMTSLPLSLSTRQSVSPGPRIIVTLTGFFVDQSLILIKKNFFFLGFLVAQLVKNLPQYGRPGFGPWVGKILWRRERLPTPVFWPGEFHGLYRLHLSSKLEDWSTCNHEWLER